MRKAASTISLATAFSSISAFVSFSPSRKDAKERKDSPGPVDSTGRLTDDFGVEAKRLWEAPDRNLREAVCTLPGFCISLFRPYRHPGVSAPVDPARTHRLFFPRRARSVSDHAASSGATDFGIPGMGRRLRPQPQNPHLEGGERQEQG